QAAAGMELKAERLAEFRAAFAQAMVEQQQSASALTENKDPLLLTVDVNDELDAVMRDLDRLEPCGEGNPRPRLTFEATVLRAREVKGGHLKLSVERAL